MIYKVSIAIALLESTTAVDVSSLNTKEKQLAYAQRVTRGSKSIQALVASKGTVVHEGDVTIAAAVSGSWVTLSGYGSCSDDNPTTPPQFEGYKMGVCAVVNNATTYYSKWACTEDDSTSEVVMTETRYTDSACSAGASVQSGVHFTPGCVLGEVVQCPVGSPYIDDDVAATYADGISSTQYETLSSCDVKTSQIGFFGGAGCVDGVHFGQDSLGIYITATCAGTPLFALPYSTLYPFNVGSCVHDTGGYDDDDDDDDTFEFIMNDNSYWSVQWDAEDDDDDCFHVDTMIDYKGAQYSYDDLLAGKEPECTVPHSPSSKGVVISTSCDKTVRVTDTHLMATTNGFQLAYSLKAGDVLFGDYDKEVCTVQSVEKEKTVQQYFGLNCVHSEVLASGLRASTFGDFHTLPSWYMTYVGSLVGSATASHLGEYIAEWYFKH